MASFVKAFDTLKIPATLRPLWFIRKCSANSKHIMALSKYEQTKRLDNPIVSWCCWVAMMVKSADRLGRVEELNDKEAKEGKQHRPCCWMEFYADCRDSSCLLLSCRPWMDSETTAAN